MHSSSEACPWSSRPRSRASRVRRFALVVLCLIAGADCRRGGVDQHAAVQGRSSHKSDCESSAGVVEVAHEALARNGDPAVRSIVSLLSATFAESRALVAARLEGCGGRPVYDVRLEAWHPHRDGHQYCSTCPVPDPALTRFASRSEAAAWMVAPPRATTFIARDIRTGQPVSVLGPVELPLGVTRLVLTPASSEQLAMLSDEMRNGQRQPRESSSR
jgi:hypothetical protein